MKKILFILIFCVIFLGNGCRNDNSLNVTNITTSTIDSFAVNSDYMMRASDQIESALKKSQKIVEIKQVPLFEFPENLKLYEKQIKYYFKLNNFYFALLQRASENIVFDSQKLDGGAADKSMLLFAHEGDKKWEIFLPVQNRSENERNNLLYFWNEKNKFYAVIHDVVGANQGEGIAKLISSENAGKNWKIERCFYLNLNEFSKLQKKQLDFVKTLNSYLKTKYKNSYLNQEFNFNSSTQKFELKEINIQTKQVQYHEMDACTNIILPSF